MTTTDEFRASGFWGLILEPGKRYSKLVDIPFHITAAVLDTISTANAEDEIVAVMLEVDGMEIIICTLSRRDGILQFPLNLKFEEGCRISFYSTGISTSVHLSGNIIGNKENYSSVAMKKVGKFVQNKRKRVNEDICSPKKMKNTSLSKAGDKIALKKLINFDKDEEEDSEEDEFDESLSEEEGINAIEKESEDSSEEDSNDEEKEMKVLNADVLKMQKIQTPQTLGKISITNETLKKPKGKKKKNVEKSSLSSSKLMKSPKKKETKEKCEYKPSIKDKSPALQKNNAPKKMEAINGKSPKQKFSGNTDGGVSTQTPSKSPKVVKMGGITCEDLVIGTGHEATLGKNVCVYYEGRLASNMKMFDKCISGKPFKFRLGAKDIIQGWNVGISGMKVGGKRKFVCPPHLAYGKRGAPPDIPPKATLVFVVDLKSLG